MTLQQIQYIIEISKCGSINKAAENLYVSQPSLSNSIKTLEKELNITIFERTNQGIQLTMDGAEFLCYARQLFEQSENIKAKYLTKEENDYQTLGISTQHYAFVVQAFINFLNSNKSSRYKFYLRETKTHDIIKDVHTKRSALGVMFLSHTTEKFIKEIFNVSEIEFHELKRVHPHIFIRRGHPLEKKVKVTVEDLIDYPYLSFEQDGVSSLDFAEELVVVDKPDKIIYVQDRATMNNIIVHTDSYNIGTGFLVPGIIDSRIISIPLESHVGEIIVGWIKLVNTRFPPEIESFISKLKKVLNV